MEISYVKPHGALYNQTAKDEKLARLIAQTVHKFDPHLKLMGLAGSLMLRIAEEEGLQTISEVFADRHYMPDGSLVPRSQPNAMVESDEEAIQQVLQMVTEGQVKAIDGSLVPVKAESICLHGDNQHSLQFAARIVDELEKNHITITA